TPSRSLIWASKSLSLNRRLSISASSLASSSRLACNSEMTRSASSQPRIASAPCSKNFNISARSILAYLFSFWPALLRAGFYFPLIVVSRRFIYWLNPVRKRSCAFIKLERDNSGFTVAHLGNVQLCVVLHCFFLVIRLAVEKPDNICVLF